MQNMVEDGAGANARTLADLDSRLVSLTQRLAQTDRALEARTEEVRFM